MRRFRSKWIAILATLALLATLLVPMVGPASAAATYTALTVPSISDDTTTDLGTVLVHSVAGSVYLNHIIILRLPTDYEFDWANLDADKNGTIDNMGYLVYAPERYSGDDNGFYGISFTGKKLADNEIELVVTNADVNKLLSNDGYLYIYLKNIKVPKGASGEVKLVIDAPATSGFSKGEVVVAKVNPGLVLISVDEVKTFTDSTTVVMRFKEAVKGAFEKDTESIKLRLPDGFEWTNVGTPTLIWGDSSWLTDTNKFEFVRDGRDLILNVKELPTKDMYFSVPLTISVEDETKAKQGDVTVTISGKTDTNPTSIVVAKYAEMGVKVYAAETPEVVAGKTEQEIGDIVIEETAPGSLIEGRTITLTLPANAKWGKLPSVDTENDVDIDDSKGFDGFVTVGKDGRTLKIWIGEQSSSEAGKITLEDAEVILEGNVTGDLVVEVSGTAGVEGKVTVAKVVAPVTAKASSKPDVKIGLTDQVAGDIEIVEGKAGAIKDEENLEVWLPSGVAFSEKPKVEVVSGDLDIDEDNIQLTDNDSRLIIPVDAESTKPSTIKISGIKYDIDRTVPVGAIKVKIGGLAVNEVNDQSVLDDYYSYDPAKQNNDNYYVFGSGSNEQIIFERDEDGAFPGADEVATVENANVVTPAPSEQKATATFKVGDTKFTVNGVEQTMDVAPYVKNGRTYLPVRYVAQALGVAPENIYYADGVVTLLKGGVAVQLTIGSNVLKVNGAEIKMDVPAELSNGRTMLPFRWVAQALGATVSWDEATQTVSMTL